MRDRSIAATRSEALPDIPTVGDFVPGYEASTFNSALADGGWCIAKLLARRRRLRVTERTRYRGRVRQARLGMGLTAMTS
jgi:hypothetical protein